MAEMKMAEMKRIRAALLCLLFCLLALFGGRTARAEAQDQSTGLASAKGGPLCVAHRGLWDGEKTAGNSLAAFKKVNEERYGAMECDVFYVKSGELFVNHKAKLADFSLYNLTRENRDDHKSGEKGLRHRVPLLEEVLQIAKEKSICLHIHVKNSFQTKGDFFGRQACRAILAVMEKVSYYDVVFFSQSRRSLKNLSEVLPGYELGYVDCSRSKEKAAENLKDLKKQLGIRWYYNICHLKGWDDEEAEEMFALGKRLGVLMGAYKVKNKEMNKRARKMNFDFILYDGDYA